jgi:formylglycine-generating enzyme required for sulfatase activity
MFEMKARLPASLLLIAGSLLGSRLSHSAAAAPLGSGFSYQGRLLESGAPANGRFDLRFELFGGETGGSPSAEALTAANVAISNGLFTTILDFGTNVFAGTRTWLEISVRPGGSPASFVTLSPRQLLTPAPYSVYTLKAESLAGPVPDSQLSTNVARLDANQTFLGAVTFSGPVGVGTSNAPAHLEVRGNVQAESFSGSGAGLSNVVATALSASLVQKLWRVSIPFVSVTNAGNEPDFTGKGAVVYSFRIGKYEVNNNQYAAFLNAVAADDPHQLYNTNMAASVHGGIERSGAPGEHAYTVKPGMGHQAVVWVDFHDALRFCNWLHNGQPTGPQDPSTTEDGAYTLTSDAVAANTVARNPQARFWLPSDDEWYKAAYHQPVAAAGDASSYWRYPTRSNDPPFSEAPPGGHNSANVCCDTERKGTPVGAYINCPSYYGTFDQAGNVQEWTEEIVFVTNRRLRGGSWNYNEFYAESVDLDFDTTDYTEDAIGFRVAGTAEP